MSNAMNLQSGLVSVNFGDSKRFKSRMSLDRGENVRISIIEESANVFCSSDAMPFGDTEGLFDDVDWELAQVVSSVYGRGA